MVHRCDKCGSSAAVFVLSAYNSMLEIARFGFQTVKYGTSVLLCDVCFAETISRWVASGSDLAAFDLQLGAH